jgi:hypothetical protein
MITQTNILDTLAYLMGESTTPTATLASRQNLIQRTLEEIYKAFPWSFASVSEVLTITDGSGEVSGDIDSQHKISVWSGTDEFAEINEADSTLYQDGDRKFWRTVEDDTVTIHTLDTDISSVTVKYQTIPPVLSSTVSTPFSDQLCVALGARRYIKLGENPDADISQDEALFQKRLNENIATAHVGRPQKRVRKIYEANNYRLGEV